MDGIEAVASRELRGDVVLRIWGSLTMEGAAQMAKAIAGTGIRSASAAEMLEFIHSDAADERPWTIPTFTAGSTAGLPGGEVLALVAELGVALMAVESGVRGAPGRALLACPDGVVIDGLLHDRQGLVMRADSLPAPADYPSWYEHVRSCGTPGAIAVVPSHGVAAGARGRSTACPALIPARY